MKTNSSVYTAHLDFRGMQNFLCAFTEKKCCSDHPLVQFLSTKVSLDLILAHFSFIFSNSQNKISILFYFCKIHVAFVVNQLIKKVWPK